MPGVQVVLITNPEAGRGRGLRHAQIALEVLRKASITATLLTPASAEQTRAMAHEAARSGAVAVVACGGDGTVHDVLQGVVDSPAALGIIAGGSGDDIAMALGLPTEPRAAAAVVAGAVEKGSRRAVDVAHAVAADGGACWFLAVLSAGFDSSVTERARSMPRLAGQRYNLAMLQELASFKPVRFHAELRDSSGGRVATLEDEAMLVAVGNGPTYGGGMRICPDAVIDDGQLDITWLHKVSRPRFLRLFPTVYRGTHVERAEVSTHRARVVRLDAPGQVAYADGERVGPLPVEITVHAAAVSVLTA